MPYRIIDSGRANFEGLLTRDEIAVLRDTSALHCLQFDRPVDPRNGARLEENLFGHRPDVELRAYAHYGDTCDLSWVAEMPSLRRFSADCLQRASAVESIVQLKHLTHLSVGIDSLRSFDFLADVSDQLEYLSLEETKSKRPSLEHLPRFKHLTTLYLSRQMKRLEVVGELPRLERLTLRSMNAPDLSFLSALSHLWSLDITLGGATDLRAITQAKRLKQLVLCWIRGLADISFIGQCTSLQNLSLDRLRQVKQLPDFSQLTKLRRLYLITLRGLESVDPVQHAPALEVISGGQAPLAPEDFRLLLQAPSLRRMTFGFGSDRKNNRFDEIAAEYGVDTIARYEEFEYRD